MQFYEICYACYFYCLTSLVGHPGVEIDHYICKKCCLITISTINFSPQCVCGVYQTLIGKLESVIFVIVCI